jgi:hypothetical protein
LQSQSVVQEPPSSTWGTNIVAQGSGSGCPATDVPPGVELVEVNGHVGRVREVRKLRALDRVGADDVCLCVESRHVRDRVARRAPKVLHQLAAVEAVGEDAALVGLAHGGDDVLRARWVLRR